MAHPWFAAYGWMVWQQPYWLLLLITLFFGLFFRSHAHYVQKTNDYLKSYQGERSFLTRVRFCVPLLCMFIAMMLIVVALGDITRGYIFVEEKARRHRIFVWVDSSSSMYNLRTKLSSITCGENAELFPRIHGACRAVSRLIADVERFSLNKRQGESEDLIGIGQFATHSYVIAYPSQDYNRLREKVRNMQFLSGGILGIYTNIHLAMWDLYLMAFDRNLRSDSKMVTHLSGKELRLLARSLEPESARSSYAPPQELAQKLSLMKEELRDTIFIFITDALVSQMDKVLNVPPYSLKKQMQLAALLELPVFYLSVDDYHLELKQLARLTGFGPLDGGHRGDFFIVRRERDFAHIEEVVGHILEARFNMTTSLPVERRESYGELCVQLALIFSVLGLVLRKTVARSLTDI